MNDKNESKNMSIIHGLLRDSGIVENGGGEQGLTLAPLAGDGSSRKFWRITVGGKGLCLAVAPPSTGTKDLAEAKAARNIGLHLLQQGVRLPKQYGWNEEYGVLLFEDLGDEKLHHYVVTRQASEDWIGQVRSCYRDVVRGLAEMQVRGSKGFKTDWCWDTAHYDTNLMLERESGYFLRAFWQNFLGKEEPLGLREEFIYIADRAALIPAWYFLHRDFQSRNIMLHQGEPYFIDFQGGRLGPLAYDLASLLIDPYVALPFGFQEELLGLYLDRLEDLIDVDRRKFVEEYLLLALQRNLQIVGAFAFLAQERKKVFFEQFLRPAITSLQTLLQCEVFAELVVLRKTVSLAGSFLGVENKKRIQGDIS